LIFELSRNATLRGGHRFVWGDASVPPSSLQLGPTEGEIRRHVALAGASVRLWQGRLRATVDFEASPGDRTFFRTGLMDYERGKARLRYRLRPGLEVQGSYSILRNRN